MPVVCASFEVLHVIPERPRARTVERAVTRDIPDLVELMHRFYAESDHVLERAWAEKSFARLLGSEDRGRAWIARGGVEPLGYVVLTLRHSMEFGALAGCIDDLFVEPGARRTGAGAALLTAALDECRLLQVAAVHVEVGTGNGAACALYRRFGFEPYSDDRQVLTAHLDE